MFATGQSIRPGPARGRTTFRRPVPPFPELARQVRAKDQDGRHCVLPHRPPPSPVVPRRLPLFSDVFRCFRRPLPPPLSPPSPAVLCSYLPSPGGSCLRPWGLSSLLMTAVLEFKDEDGLHFAVPSRSGVLAVPPPGPTGAPDG